MLGLHLLDRRPVGGPVGHVERDEGRPDLGGDPAGLVAVEVGEDDGARPVPFTMSGGTDAKSFERLGMRCFGFSPLRLPPDLDFASLFHGIDERVPVESLRFGIRVLDRFVRSL